jgi:hypothetical protein
LLSLPAVYSSTPPRNSERIAADAVLSPLVPAKAGTQEKMRLDSRLRGNERWRGPRL